MHSPKGVDGKISDEIVIKKVFRTLLPIYAIRVSTIQELRCTHGNDLTLDSLVSRIISFELSFFDNFIAPTIESFLSHN